MYKQSMALCSVPSNKVRLISNDGIEYVISIEIAFLSQTLKTFFDTNYPFKEAQTRTVVLPIKSKFLKRIIEFMEYKHMSQNSIVIPDFKIADDETMELLDVASYLRI